MQVPLVAKQVEEPGENDPEVMEMYRVRLDGPLDDLVVFDSVDFTNRST